MAKWSIESISAISDTLEGYRGEDTLAMHIKWKNGTLGTMAVTMLTYPENLEDQLQSLEKRKCKTWRTAVNNFDHWKFDLQVMMTY